MACAGLIMAAVNIAFDQGKVADTYKDLANAPYFAIFAGIVPVLLFRQFRRGNREAGMLIIFLFFWSLSMYAVIALAVLHLMGILGPPAAQISHWINGFPFGPLSFSVFDLGTLLFWVSLALIMVLRATRTSRLQAVLEGEMAAARAV